MIKDYRNFRHIMVACLSTLTIAILSGCATASWDINNPYAEVDWKQTQRVNANLHTHTKESDGHMEPATVIDEYRKLGYGALALTDHNKVTWPWETYERDSAQLEMIAVQGAEASRHHHICTYFCNVPGTKSEEGTLANVREQKGIAVMNHPGRYKWTTEEYTALYRTWDELVGMEIFNQGDRYPKDREAWDKVLTVLMPEGRPVWGLSNDDMHQRPHLGRNWNVLLLPEFSPKAVRTAIEKGAFFFAYSPNGHENDKLPAISSIVVDSRKGTIQIETANEANISWISEGRIVHQGAMIDLTTTPGLHGYIRAMIYAPDEKSLVGTQPIGIRRKK
jgi:hypothetical protein